MEKRLQLHLFTRIIVAHMVLLKKYFLNFSLNTFASIKGLAVSHLFSVRLSFIFYNPIYSSFSGVQMIVEGAVYTLNKNINATLLFLLPFFMR